MNTEIKSLQLQLRNSNFNDYVAVDVLNENGTIDETIFYQSKSNKNYNHENSLKLATLIVNSPELYSAAQYAISCLKRLSDEMGQIGDNGDQALQALEAAINNIKL